jgi:hypothetical protein
MTLNADGSVTITPAELHAAMREEPRDMTLALREGDWITVPGNAQGTVWQAGHVEHIYRAHNAPVWRADDGWRIVVGYAGRESSLPSFYRCHATRNFVTTDEVGEIWRRRRVLRGDQFEHEGRTVLVQSSEYEWYQVL